MKNNNENIALYIPFNGKAGQTNAKDYSINDHVLTFNGNTKIVNSHFYRPEIQSSLELNGGGSTIPDSDTFTLGSNDFTIAITFNRAGNTGRQYFFGQMDSSGSEASTSFMMYFESDNSLTVFVISGTTYYTTRGPVPDTTDKWVNGRFIRKNNVLYLYENNKLVDTTECDAVVNDSNNLLGIGQGGEYVSENASMYIQEVLIVNGEAWDDWAFNNSVITGHVNLDDYRQYLIASYPLTESSGDAIDVIGGNTLTDNGGVGSIENFRGELARDFDGSDDYFIGDYLSQGASTMLVSVFFRLDGTDKDQSIVWSLLDVFGGAIRLLVKIRSNNVIGIGMRDDVNGSFIGADSSLTVSAGVDYHIVAYFDTINNKQYAYVNNAEWINVDKTMNNFPTDDGAGMGLGARPRSDGSDIRIQGTLSYLNFYKDITFADDTERESFVSTLYNNGRANVIELSQQRSDGTFVPAKQYAQRFYDPELDSLQNYMTAYWNGCDLYDRVHHHVLTNYNGVTFEDGINNKAYRIDASVDKYLTYPHADWNDFGGDDFTISFWVKLDSDTTSQIFINKAHVYYIQYSGGVYNAYFWLSDGNSYHLTSTVTTINVWHHIVFCRKGLYFYLYIDGNEVSNFNNSSNYDIYNNVVETKLCDPPNNAIGFITEYMILKGYGLSADEVANLYNSGIGKFLTYNPDVNRPYPAEHLIDVWPLDEYNGNRSSVKNSYIASDNNSVSSASGISKPYSALFDGTNYLSVANATYSISSVLATKTWTLGFWYKSAETSNNSLMGCRNSSNYGFDIQINSSQGYIDILFDNIVQISTDISCDDHSFKRIIITCTNDVLKLYVNNVLVATKMDSGSLSNAAIAFYLGGLNVSGTLTNGFTGQLQEFILLDIPVDESFINDDYNNGVGRFYAPYTESNAMLNEDGTTALWEDGNEQILE